MISNVRESAGSFFEEGGNTLLVNLFLGWENVMTEGGEFGRRGN